MTDSPSSFPAPASGLLVSAAEHGMKLLRFLERRLEPGHGGTQLHKWLRTGQVRVNGGRAKAWQLLAEGDSVRVPPFALLRELAPTAETNPATVRSPGRRRSSFEDTPAAPPPAGLGSDLQVAAVTPTLLVLNKPGGLACQPGTGNEDSVAGLLRRAFAGSAYIPAPAHRLDRHTSGLVVAAKTHQAQQRLHALFAEGGVRKEYLAWVFGVWPSAGPCLLRDMLAVRRDAGGEAVLPGGSLTALPSCVAVSALVAEARAGEGAEGRSAVCAVQPVQTLARAAFPRALRAVPGGVLPERASLLLIRLFTGRKHQIRVQLSARGFPLIGDGRYGGPDFPGMLLHAYALALPPEDDQPGGQWREFSVPPPWRPPFAPDYAALSVARNMLAQALQNCARAGTDWTVS